MTGYVDVRTNISTDEYKRLNALAKVHNTTVGALIAELTRRALAPKQKGGRPTKYTPELGERIWEARWMHRSWEQIAATERIHEQTVKKYHARFEAETGKTNPKENDR